MNKLRLTWIITGIIILLETVITGYLRYSTENLKHILLITDFYLVGAWLLLLYVLASIIYSAIKIYRYYFR